MGHPSLNITDEITRTHTFQPDPSNSPICCGGDRGKVVMVHTGNEKNLTSTAFIYGIKEMSVGGGEKSLTDDVEQVKEGTKEKMVNSVTACKFPAT